MHEKLIVIVAVFLLSLSGCIAPPYQNTDQNNPFQQEPAIIAPAPIPSEAATVPVMTEKRELLIDRISENLTSFYDRKWNMLYHADELDCSRMSTYFWDYIRRNFHVAPKIIISYERQHAWLALKVSDVGNSTDYSHWNIKGTDYYFVEAAIYILDTPQDANDFNAQNSALGGWNQEFRLKKGDLDKISRLLTLTVN